jgi:hypothetical protein
LVNEFPGTHIQTEALLTRICDDSGQPHHSAAFLVYQQAIGRAWEQHSSDEVARIEGRERLSA